MPATTQLQNGQFVFEEELPKFDEISRYRAIDTVREAAVEIFELPFAASSSHGSSDGDSFSKRADVLARFRHPLIIPITSTFSEDGRHFVVSDPVEGNDLAAVLAKQNGPIPVETAAEWADQLLDVLFRLNTTRPPQVHLCVRPSTVFLDANGNAALSIASSLWGRDATLRGEAGRDDPDSLPYSPLEQLWPGLDAASQKVIISKLEAGSGKILTQELDGRSDIYSLGATVYFLITGKPPLDALERSIEVIDGKTDPLISPNSLDPRIPREISDVIMKALEIRREFRFDSAAIMRQVLRSARLRAKERIQKGAYESGNAEIPSAVSLEHDSKASPVGSDDPSLSASSLRPAGSKAEASPSPPSGLNSAAETAVEDDLLGIMSTTNEDWSADFSSKGSTDALTNWNPDENRAASDVRLGSQASERLSAHGSVQDHIASSVFTESKSHYSSGNNGVDQESAKSSDVARSTKSPVEADPIQADSWPEDASGSSEIDVPAGRGGVMALAAAAGVVLILATAGWVFLGPANASPAAPASLPVQTRDTAAEPESDSRVSQFPADSAPADDVPVIEESTRTSAVQKQVDTEPPKPPATAAKQKPKAPSANPTPERKKTVTVDDLINDN